MIGRFRDVQRLVADAPPSLGRICQESWTVALVRNKGCHAKGGQRQHKTKSN